MIDVPHVYSHDHELGWVNQRYVCITIVNLSKKNLLMEKGWLSNTGLTQLLKKAFFKTMGHLDPANDDPIALEYIKLPFTSRITFKIKSYVT